MNVTYIRNRLNLVCAEVGQMDLSCATDGNQFYYPKFRMHLCVTNRPSRLQADNRKLVFAATSDFVGLGDLVRPGWSLILGRSGGSDQSRRVGGFVPNHLEFVFGFGRGDDCVTGFRVELFTVDLPAHLAGTHENDVCLAVRVWFAGLVAYSSFGVFVHKISLL
jgi:hypothetical protein